jgi:hypothetical protein
MEDLDRPKRKLTNRLEGAGCSFLLFHAVAGILEA